MKILIGILVVVAIGWLIAVYVRPKPESQAPTYATRAEIPSIVSRLQQTGQEESFVVFMFSIPGNHDETLPNLQYSIENGRLGFDWVLMAPQNIKDEARLSAFVKGLGYTVSKREMNGVKYLRIEGAAVEELGMKVLHDFYQLAADARLELIVDGFDLKS